MDYLLRYALCKRHHSGAALSSPSFHPAAADARLGRSPPFADAPERALSRELRAAPGQCQPASASHFSVSALSGPSSQFETGENEREERNDGNWGANRMTERGQTRSVQPRVNKSN